MFRSILVAIDGSAHAARALAQATDLARSENAKLTLITSAPNPAAWVGGGLGGYAAAVDIAGLEREVEEEHRGLLEQAVAELPAELPVTKILGVRG